MAPCASQRESQPQGSAQPRCVPGVPRPVPSVCPRLRRALLSLRPASALRCAGPALLTCPAEVPSVRGQFPLPPNTAAPTERRETQHRLSLPRSRAEFFALASEAEFEVSAGRAHLRALGRDPLPSSCNCWQNPLPRGCRTEVPLSPPAPSGEPSSASRASRPPLLPAPSPFGLATECQILPVLCVSDFLFCLQPEKSLCLYRGQISAPHPTPDILPFLKANVPYQG